jgi:hypothetical protein
MPHSLMKLVNCTLMPGYTYHSAFKLIWIVLSFKLSQYSQQLPLAHPTVTISELSLNLLFGLETRIISAFMAIVTYLLPNNMNLLLMKSFISYHLPTISRINK